MVTELTILSDLIGVRRAQELIEKVLQTSGYTYRDIFAAKLSIEEALIDAIKFGNGMDPDKRIYVLCTATSGRFIVRITDENSGTTRTVSSFPPT